MSFTYFTCIQPNRNNIQQNNIIKLNYLNAEKRFQKKNYLNAKLNSSNSNEMKIGSLYLTKKKTYSWEGNKLVKDTQHN